MNHIDYKRFRNLAIKEQLVWLTENNIFQIAKNETIDNLILLQKEYLLPSIDFSFLLNRKYLLPSEPANTFLRKLILEQFKQILSNDSISEYESRYRDLYFKRIKNVDNPELKKAHLRRIKKKINKTFKKNNSCRSLEGNLRKIDLLKCLEGYWHKEIRSFLDYSLINLDIYAYVLYGEKLKNEEFRKFSKVFDLFQYALEVQKALDFLHEEKIKLKILSENPTFNFSVKNVKDEINRFPEIFKSAYDCEFFHYCILKEGNLSNRLLSIYFFIFQSQQRLHQYRGVNSRYKEFIKKSFEFKMSKIESDFGRDIDFEKSQIKIFSNKFQDLSN